MLVFSLCSCLDFGRGMKKVLLVCFDNLGDLVFASGLAKALSQESESRVSLLCKDYTSKLGYLLPGIEQVFAADPFWDKSPNRRKGKFANYLKCLLTVRDAKFDEAYIVGGHWQSALSLRLMGIPRIYAFKGRKNSLFLTKALPMPRREVPVVKGIADSFGSVISSTVPTQTELLKSSLPHFERPESLREKKIVVLHAFAGSIKRCAPLEIWGALAQALKAKNFHVLWTGIPQETAQIRKAFPGEWDNSHFVDTWALDLLQLAWIWSEAELFVGHDSGPLHVANALGVPVLGLYLPGEPSRTFPQGKAKSHMIHKSSPRELGLDEVLAGAFSLLEG